MEIITRKINIAIVDDHWAILEGYQSLLKKLTYVNSVHVFTTSEAFFEETKHTHFDLVLLDIQLKDEDGLDICKIIKEEHKNIKVIMESMFDNANYILEAYQINADGYILKDSHPNELRHAIERVFYHNEKYFTPLANKIILDKIESDKQRHTYSKSELSNREIEIIPFICEGKANKEIAEMLCLSETTVATHRKHIYKKTNCHNSIQVLNYCIKNDLYIPPKKDSRKLKFGKFLKTLLPK